MDVKVETKKLVWLSLDENEARLLRALVQNPLGPGEEEPPEVRRLRENIWNALAACN